MLKKEDTAVPGFVLPVVKCAATPGLESRLRFLRWLNPKKSYVLHSNLWTDALEIVEVVFKTAERRPSDIVSAQAVTFPRGENGTVMLTPRAWIEAEINKSLTPNTAHARA